MSDRPTNTDAGGPGPGSAGASPSDMPMWESLHEIAAANFGRLCIIADGYPLAFPMSFRVVGEHPHLQIVVRTSPDNAIGRYHGPASLEVDDIDGDAGRAWSVIVRGDLRPMYGLPAELDPTAIDPRPLVKTGRSRWMTLAVSSISGRRFVSRPAAHDFAVDWQYST